MVTRIFHYVMIAGVIILSMWLTCIAALISFAAFANYDDIRDNLGNRYIDGYYVTHGEDTDDVGRNYMTSEPHTEHWYSRVGIWLFEWALLLLFVFIPAATWFACAGGIKALERERPPSTYTNP